MSVADPVVSVIIATYNRSDVLRHAIQSVLGSTLRELEVIVVGDHCDDDTAAVVESIGDARVRFVNLPVHGGDQSRPNNRGVELARGRFIAFLNHDDLFFPDHLACGVEQLQREHGDFLWAATLAALPAGPQVLQDGAWSVRIDSTPPTGKYDPYVFCIASSWIVTRDLAERVGPWRPGRELYVTSSRDWMFRVWRSGARMIFRPQPGALVVHSGPRKNSYVSRSPEHDVYAKQMRENPRFREELLERAARQPAPPKSSGPTYPFPRLRRLLTAPLRGLLILLGVHPASLYILLFGRRGRGAVTRQHRQRVGLPPI